MKKFFIFFILATTIIFSFNISNFLYTNEQTDLTFKELSLPEGTYTLYYVKNLPILLVFNSQIINDTTKIKDVLSRYYSSYLLLDGKDKEEFENKIKEFNKSRDLPVSLVSNIKSNYGTESYCMQSLALYSYPCNSSQSCLTTANIVCALFATGGGQGSCDPYILGPIIYDYSSQIKVLNSEVNSIFNSLSSLSIENSAEKYSSILKSIQALEEAAKKIGKSRLMVVGGDLGVCYNPKFDFLSLNAAKDIITKYNSKTDEIKDLDATVKIIHTNSQERIAFFNSKSKLELLSPKWEEIKRKYGPLFNKSTNYSSLILDQEFVETYKKFSSSWNSLENKFTTFDSSFIQEDLDLLELLAPKLSSLTNKSSIVYLDAIKAKKEVESKLLYIKYSLFNNEENKAKYLKLEEKKKALDKAFSPPLSTQNYLKAKEQYSLFSQELDQFSSYEASSSLLNSLSESFSHSTIAILYSFTDSLSLLNANQKKEFARFIPPVFLLLIDLAILSVFSIIFFGVVIKFKQLFKQKRIVTVWLITFLLFIFFVLAGSIAFYFVMESSEKSAKLPEFINIIKENPKFYIVLADVSRIQPETLEAMRSCSKSISNAIKSNFKKDVLVVELATSISTCHINGKKQDFGECQALLVGQPNLELKPSSKENLEFSLLYEKRATYSGSKTDFDFCYISSAFGLK